MTIIVVVAHPDDEVLGCGGTIANLSREGHDVYVAILGEGITSRYKNRNSVDLKLLETLKENCKAVAKLLGAKDIFLYGLPDNRFDTIPLLDIVKIIEELVECLQPQVVYTHHGGDLNIDHVIVNRAVLTATRPVKGQSVREVYAFEVPSSTEWSFQHFEPIFHPNVFVDISNTIETKIKALTYYDTEIRAFPHPRSSEGIRAIACRWGTAVGKEAVEAFELIRMIR